MLDGLRRLRRKVLDLEERWFDWRYGTETAAFVPADEVQTESESRVAGFDYQPSDPRTFQRMLRTVPADRSAYTFIDFGCGKGRALLLAAQLGFRRVIGVEYSRPLTAIAGRNTVAFQPRVPLTPIEVVHADAIQFRIPDEDCVFFFFNPFNREIMEKVAENIRRANAVPGRCNFVVLWHCERYYPIFDQIPSLRRLHHAAMTRTWLTKPIYEWGIYGPDLAPSRPD